MTLPIDVTGKVFTFLSPQDGGAAAAVCWDWNIGRKKSFTQLAREFEQLPLHNIFRATFEACKDDRFDNAHLGKKTIQFVPVILSVEKGVLTQEEWSQHGFDFSMRPIRDLTYKEMARMAQCISNKRANILISFFQNIAETCPAAAAFQQSLGFHLPPLYIAREIQNWMKTNPTELARFVNIPIDEENFIGIAPESTLSIEQVGLFFIRAAASGHLETVNALIGSNRFQDISAAKLGRALERAGLNGHLPCLNALIGSTRFQDISTADLGLAVYWAAHPRGFHCANALIRSNRFQDIPAADLQLAFLSAARHGHLPCLNTLIGSTRFQEISSENLRFALIEATLGGNLPCVIALIQAGLRSKGWALPVGLTVLTALTALGYHYLLKQTAVPYFEGSPPR